MWAFMLGIVSWVIGAVATVGTAIVSSLAAVIPILFAMWEKIFAVFKVAAGAIAKVSSAVWSFVKPVWTQILRPVVTTLLEYWDRFYTFLNKVISPILDGLEWIIDVVTGLYYNYVQPVLDWMERVRLVLSGLGSLGVGWAGNLANLISTVQDAINQVFRTVLEHLYQVVNIINDLVDPAGWIKGRIFLTSVRRWSGGVVSILVGIGIDPELELRRRRAEAEAVIPTIPMVVDQWSEAVIREHPAVRSIRKDWKEGRIRERSQSPR